MAKRKKSDDSWSTKLDGALYKKFRIKFETYFNIIDMAMITRRKDEKPLTESMRDYISGFMDCMDLSQ